MGGHHLILGEMKDYLTGHIIEDSHDERYRQKIARYLVEQKGFAKAAIRRNQELLVRAGEKRAIIRIALVIRSDDLTVLVINYGPGSLVTRLRPTLALSRLVEPYQVPFAAVTNGEEVNLLDVQTGKVRAVGFKALPSRKEVFDYLNSHELVPLTDKAVAMESRIAFAYEVDGSCPCDDTICRL
jgi:hypothetical protein